MELLRRLKSEHEIVKTLLESLARTGPKSIKKRAQLYNKLRQELLPHMEAEEEVFYPMLLERGRQDELLREAIEEHQTARTCIAALDTTALEDERWHAKLTVIAELLLLHIQKEERQIFPLARKVIKPVVAQELLTRFEQAEMSFEAAEVQQAL